MSDYKNLLSEFDPASKAAWEQQVLKELKSRPLEDLHWAVGTDLDIPPFFHVEDGVEAVGPLHLQKETNDWEIGEDIWAEDLTAANKAALQALTNGAESICFVLPKGLHSVADLEVLLKGIEVTFISIYFKLMDATVANEFADQWKEYMTGLNAATSEIKGGIVLDFFEVDGTIDVVLLKKLMEMAGTFPEVSFLSVDFHIVDTSFDGQVETLALTLAKGSEYLAMMNNWGIAAELVSKQLLFNLEIGNSYLMEIAKVRAFRLMWQQVLQAYKVQGTTRIDARLSASAYTDDQYSNMIRATAMGMSAVMGGVDRLTILPANATREAPGDFTRRVARNLQHLFKMESYLDRVIDPAAGSYYLEHLTRQIGERAWSRFQEIEAGGGYLQMT